MLISSPPRVPCSTSHSSPVAGCSVAAWTLRWPNDQISGRTPSLPTNGLSFGIDAVGVDADDLAEQAVHPLRLHAALGDRALALRDEQRAVARRTPAGRRSAAASSATAPGGRSPARSRRAAPRRRRSVPRATAVLFTPPRAARRSSSRSAGWSRTPGRAPRRAGRPGRARPPPAGRRPARTACRRRSTTRSRPGRSVTSILPSGRNARPHGLTAAPRRR